MTTMTEKKELIYFLKQNLCILFSHVLVPRPNLVRISIYCNALDDFVILDIWLDSYKLRDIQFIDPTIIDPATPEDNVLCRVELEDVKDIIFLLKEDIERCIDIRAKSKETCEDGPDCQFCRYIDTVDFEKLISVFRELIFE